MRTSLSTIIYSIVVTVARQLNVGDHISGRARAGRNDRGTASIKLQVIDCQTAFPEHMGKTQRAHPSEESKANASLPSGS